MKIVAIIILGMFILSLLMALALLISGVRLGRMREDEMDE